MLCTNSKSCSSKFGSHLNKIVETLNILSVKEKIPENSSFVTVMDPPPSLFYSFLTHYLERKHPECIVKVALIGAGCVSLYYLKAP